MDELEAQHWNRYQAQLDQEGYDELASRVEAVIKHGGTATTEPEKAIRICTLNDLLRVAGIGGEIYSTQGIAALSEATTKAVVSAIRTFTDFNEGNDPYKEHDCTILEAAGVRGMFKIDYYDISKQYGSESPENPSVTSRVMTIMKASEY